MANLTRAELRVRGAMSTGKSPVEIAAELGADERFGYTAEEVYAIIRKILDSLDAYTLDDQLKLAVLDLKSLAAMAKDNYEVTGRAEHLRGAVEALDKVLVHVEHLQQNSQAVLESVDQKHAEMLVGIVEKSFDRSLGELLARFPGASEDEIRGTFQRHLLAVAREQDSVNASERMTL